MTLLYRFPGQFKSPSGSRNLPPMTPIRPTVERPSLGPRYEWTDVGMIGYNEKTNRYLVKRVSVPKDISLPATGSEGSSAEEEEEEKEKDTVSSNIQYWVPRIRLLFAAEDPFVFSERVSKAYELRRETEAMLRYHLYIDCMPINKDVGVIQTGSLNRMTAIARSSEGLQQPR